MRYKHLLKYSFLFISCNQEAAKQAAFDFKQKGIVSFENDSFLNRKETDNKQAGSKQAKQNDVIDFFRLNQFPKWAKDCNYISLKNTNKSEGETYALISDERHRANISQVPFDEFICFRINNQIVFFKFISKVQNSKGFPIWQYESESYKVTVEIVEVDKMASSGVLKFYNGGKLKTTIEVNTGNIY